jgi:hypothetical protein
MSDLEQKIKDLIDETYKGSNWMYHDLVPKLLKLFEETKCE